ncbi:MAG: hypothetical protein M1813_009849 [Trichoglossum hirsutum]|nr:MAG: hypothetical protein M1813_009849 [Trichoglossum hirsutum]
MEPFLDFEKWSICWEISLAFGVKFKNSWTRKCVKCGREIPHRLTEWGSEFISSAVSSPCGHSRDGILCSACEEGMAMRIVKAEQRCFVFGCRERLTVSKAALKTGLSSNEELLQRYLKLGEFECVVCGDMSFPRRPVTLNCEHPINTCADSVQDMIQASLTGGAWTGLRCPEPSCREKLEFADIEYFAAEETFKCYQTLLVLRSIANLPDFKWCVSGKCPWGERHPLKDSNQFVHCSKCDLRFCFDCEGKWHEDETCEQYKASVADGGQQKCTEILVRTCKRCPVIGCGAYIQKVKACHEIECANCSASFCWVCKIILNERAGYSERNRTQHLKDCIAPNVFQYRSNEYYKYVEKPSIDSGRYRVGWDQDVGFVGTGEEWSEDDLAALHRNQAIVNQET